jgi:hypothetical protein
MTAAAPPAWNLFKQIFTEHWDGFKHVPVLPYALL